MARVVIVDDNLMIRTVLREILTAGGHEVIGEADSGNTAPAVIRELRPDLVTLDLVMPGRSGLATLSQLLIMNPELLVVICSASLTEDRVTEGLRQGAKGFILKPVTRERVLDGVADAFSFAHGRHPQITAPDTATISSFAEKQREFDRVDVRVPVMLETATGRHHTTSVNLSAGGVVVAAAPVAVGQQVGVRLQLDGRQAPVDGGARVARMDPDGHPALVFERLIAGDHDRMLEFLAQQTAAPSAAE